MQNTELIRRLINKKKRNNNEPSVKNVSINPTPVSNNNKLIYKPTANNNNFNQKLIKNIINKDFLGRTSYGNTIYGKLWYVDNRNKICITFTPRAGCSISFQQYLDLVGLLEDGLKYNEFIHEYRTNIFVKNVKYQDINTLIKDGYTFIKFIMNPYIRAVSIFRAQTSHNLSFREYLKELNSNKIGYFNANDKLHLYPQYIKGEEKIITKYIKVNENEKYTIILCDGNPYTFDVNKFTSCHHGKKNPDKKDFCGDIPLDNVRKDLPCSYKYFYDEEIKKMVEKYYKDDIEKYGFTFDF